MIYLDSSGVSPDVFIKRWILSRHLKMLKDVEDLLGDGGSSEQQNKEVLLLHRISPSLFLAFLAVCHLM